MLNRVPGLCVIVAIVFATTFALAAGAQTTPPADEHPTLPAGEGRELTIHICSQCHAVDVVAEQELDAAGWKSLVDQMASMGATASDAELEQIVRYLTKAFPPPK